MKSLSEILISLVDVVKELSDIKKLFKKYECSYRKERGHGRVKTWTPFGSVYNCRCGAFRRE